MTISLLLRVLCPDLRNHFSTCGISLSIWISTMATIANPESKAEVRLEAFNLALLNCGEGEKSQL